MTIKCAIDHRDFHIEFSILVLVMDMNTFFHIQTNYPIRNNFEHMRIYRLLSNGKRPNVKEKISMFSIRFWFLFFVLLSFDDQNILLDIFSNRDVDSGIIYWCKRSVSFKQPIKTRSGATKRNPDENKICSFMFFFTIGDFIVSQRPFVINHFVKCC